MIRGHCGIFTETHHEHSQMVATLDAYGESSKIGFGRFGDIASGVGCRI